MKPVPLILSLPGRTPLLAVLAFLALAACGNRAPNADAAQPQEEAAGSADGNAAGAALKAGFSTAHRGEAPPDTPFETSPAGETATIAAVLAAHPGKKLLVNLWATWCAPCLRELPTLDALAAAHGEKLVVYPVSQDMEGWQKVSPAFTTAKYPHLGTALDSKMALGMKLGAQALPVSILYGADGREIWRYLGDRDWTSAESLEKLGL